MIFYLKSSISISSYNGCTIGCKYCILSELGNRNNVEKVCDEEKLVNDLLDYKLYNQTIPITINNQSDPFLNDIVFESTIKILQLLQEKNIKNPVILITKGYLTDEKIEILSKISLKLFILYTFSGMSETLENRDKTRQIETLNKLSNLNNIILLNYYRPIIEGVNSDIETIKKVVSIVTKYCKASIISGIRVTKTLQENLKDYKISLPLNYSPKYKYINNETYLNILNEFKKANINNYFCFKKTSCGISYFCNMPDYNGNSSRLNYCKPTCSNYEKCKKNDIIGFCNSSCPNYSKCVENSKKVVTPTQFTKLLTHIKRSDSEFSIEEKFIFLKGTFSQEELYFLRHTSSKNIKAEHTLKRYDESLLET